MKRPFLQIIMSMLFLLCLNPGFSQTFDYAEFARYVTPPLVSEFIVFATQEEIAKEKIVYTRDFSYHNQTVLKLETFSTTASKETSLHQEYLSVDDTSIILWGTTFNEPSFGKIELTLDPPVRFPRFADQGQVVEQSADTKVSLGLIPVILTFQIIYHFIDLETVVTPLGTFENALKVETEKKVSLSGLELASQKTINWFHPLAGLIKEINVQSNESVEMNAITPTISLPTLIPMWSLY